MRRMHAHAAMHPCMHACHRRCPCGIHLHMLRNAVRYVAGLACVHAWMYEFRQETAPAPAPALAPLHHCACVQVVLEGGSLAEARANLVAKFAPTLTANYALW